MDGAEKVKGAYRQENINPIITRARMLLAICSILGDG